MRRARPLVAAIIGTALTALFTSVSASAQSSDDDLRVYAVGVSRGGPFIWPYSGYGIYLGESAIITAAHVVGRWSIFANPTITIAGLKIEAKVIKKGSFPQLDLAQLSIEQASLPVSLRLRRNPLCKDPPYIGTNVVVVSPEKTERSRITSPLEIAPEYRSFFSTLISERHVSGSGVFDAEKKCLLGIVSAAITRNTPVRAPPTPPSIRTTSEGEVGYFVPAYTIAGFLPERFRF